MCWPVILGWPVMELSAWHTKGQFMACVMLQAILHVAACPSRSCRTRFVRMLLLQCASAAAAPFPHLLQYFWPAG